MNGWDAVYYPNINWSQTAGSTAAGGVGGAVAAPIAGLAGSSLVSKLAWTGLGGAVGGMSGGQTGSLVEATVSELDAHYSGFGYDGDRLFQTASANGFLDPNSLLMDAASGVVFAWAGEGLKSALNSALTPGLRDPALTPVIEMKPVLGQGVQGRIAYYDGRVLTLQPNQFHALMQALSQGSRNLATDLLVEWLQQQAPNE
jgi:hypothetical protein